MLAYFTENAKRWKEIVEKELRENEEALVEYEEERLRQSEVTVESGINDDVNDLLETYGYPAIPQEELQKAMRKISVGDLVQLMSLLSATALFLGINSRASLDDVFMAFSNGEFSRYDLAAAIAKAKQEIEYDGNSELVNKITKAILSFQQSANEREAEVESEEPNEIGSEERSEVVTEETTEVVSEEPAKVVSEEQSEEQTVEVVPEQETIVQQNREQKTSVHRIKNKKRGMMRK
jgi:hypothetical protein